MRSRKNIQCCGRTTTVEGFLFTNTALSKNFEILYYRCRRVLKHQCSTDQAKGEKKTSNDVKAPP